MITLLCGRCGNPAAHALRKLVTKFTLFFIPLFPLSTKHHLECTWCGAASPIAAQQLSDLLARANAESMGAAPYQQSGPHAQWPQQPAPNFQQPALGAPNTQWPQQPGPQAPDANRQR
ncbi:zinc-ribbon domain-containing protein [Nocardia niwae]|uniref:Zinc-ribbon domain-containing protein n=1 Tax=Nocardia niwae TaxID=626084 RepID=A0ABV2XDC4_9NOCA|nr:zinc-ribbon domain-containing protein [Nocardia niwae]